MRAETPSAAIRARDAVARGDWAAAAPLLREALATDTQDVSLHYSLGVSGTHLDNHDEAVREFTWVVRNASPESAEHKGARAWLAETKTSDVPAAAPVASETTSAPSREILHVDRTGDAGLYGQVTWSADPGGPASTKRLQIHLTGVPGTSSKEQRYTVRTDDEGRYEFKQIVAGPYKVTDRIAGTPTWRLRVEVQPGRDTAFDLSPANSVTVRDDFPNGR
jgi:hypothetical protein